MQLPEPGEQFENAYLLDEVLGSGGFAVVFGATELAESARKVAIKVLRPDKQGRYEHDVETRFAREVASLARLNNPHTMQIFAHGKTESGLLYLVSEYIPGRDLDELMGERRLASEEVLQILRQLLQALHEAHTAGLLHRDIKPRNIRVAEVTNGLHVKLLDFGVAKSAFGGATKDLTKTGELLGTPQYMSPEQLTERRLGPASDIYSLGLVTYEMLTGGKIHGPRWGDQLDRLESGHVFSIPELERMGPGLTKIVEKMSARHAEHRYQSAAEVLRALDDLEEGKTLPEYLRPTVQDVVVPRTVAPTVPDIQYKHPMHHSWEVRLLGLALLVMTGAVGWFVFLADADPPAATEPLPTRTNDVRVLTSQETPRVEDPPPRPLDVPDEVTGPSAGCGAEPPFRGQGELETMVGLSVDRWTVHIPTDYDSSRAYPLLILFHPDVSNGADILTKTAFGAVADEHGFVILAPDDSGLFAWRADDAHHSIRGLVARTSDQLCLDPRRVFAAGHGVGGFAVEQLACRGWLAGIATNAFRRSEEFCGTESRPVPFIHFAPMASVRIPVAGGKGCNGMEEKPSVSEFEAEWRGRNGCEGAAMKWLQEGKHECLTWTCATAFVSCHLDGGYSWPGSGIEEISPGCEDRPIRGFDASQIIWKFFQPLALADDATPAW